MIHQKTIIIILFLLCFIVSKAQVETDDGLLPLTIQREACVLAKENSNMSRREANGMRRISMFQKDAPLSSIGAPEIVVCLANFSDVKFTVAETVDALMALFEKFFNGQDVSGEIGGNKHSMSEYFRISSKGMFTPHFNVMQPVTVECTQEHAKNDRTAYRDLALQALDSQVKDRVSDFDANNDGLIDGVIIVYPEIGVNSGGKGPHACCWPWMTTVNTTRYATQLIGPEMRYGNKINGIGLFVHEMSHMLGLPDMYATSSTKDSFGNVQQPGMDFWSVMDAGFNTYSGCNPTPYTAYEKSYLGWITLTELTEPTSVTGMKTLAEGGEAYKVVNDGNSNEYYILENRNSNDVLYSGVEALFGAGLMIYHVDEDETKWNYNILNNDPKHQRMTIIPANGHIEALDNLYYTDLDKYVSEMVGHLWPLKTSDFKSACLKDAVDPIAYWGLTDGNNKLTDTLFCEGDRMAPAATLYSDNTDGVKLMHKPITDIVQNGDMTISFKYMQTDTSSGITDVNVEEQPIGTAAYNLAGQHVTDSYKGFCIVRRKKILRK